MSTSMTENSYHGDHTDNLDLAKDESFCHFVDIPTVKIPQSPACTSEYGSLQTLHGLFENGKYNEIKQFIRNNYWPINHPIRAKLWLHIIDSDGEPVFPGFYEDSEKQIFTSAHRDVMVHLPGFVDHSLLLNYHLTSQGIVAVSHVLAVLNYNYPSITFCPIIYCISSLLLHYMTESDCFNSLTNLVNSKKKTFIAQTKLSNEVTWRTVMMLTKKYTRTPFGYISNNCKSIEMMERFFEKWQTWIFHYLPFHYIVKILDCFFFEGPKVLYRVFLAIIILFYRHSSKSSSCYHQYLTTSGLNDSFQKFCRDMPVSIEKLLKTAFGIRNFNQNIIQKTFLKNEMCLKSKSLVSGTPGLKKSHSSDGLPSFQSQNNIQMMSHSLTIKEGQISPQLKVTAMGDIPLGTFKSTLINNQQLITLWNWLPQRVTMYQPKLIYTTDEHGCSLTTFYNRVEEYEPTVLVIKTRNGEIFGAYCSTAWKERNAMLDSGLRQTYFGTGETFLFTMCPQVKRYQWVGITGETTTQDPQVVKHGTEQFMAGDHHMITLGGGKGQAIWIDSDLRYGKSESCITFDNPPLCASRDFEVMVIEVYSFGM